MDSNNLNNSGSADQENEHHKLAAYRNVKSKAIIAASLLIPFGTVALLVLFCQRQGGAYALDASVAVSDLQRIALIVHGIYFIMLPFCFELMIGYGYKESVPRKQAKSTCVD